MDLRRRIEFLSPLPLKMGIAHEMISFSEGQTSYRVMVFSFEHKMNTWKAGRMIRLKYFKIDGIRMRLQLYPNGNTRENENHVSFFLENDSSVDIDLLYDIQMGSKRKLDNVKDHVKAGAGNSTGLRYFYDHDENNEGDDDEDFEITLTIKKLWKQFDEDGVDSNVSNNVERAEQKLESLENSMKRLMDKNESLETSMKSMQNLVKKVGKVDGATASIQTPYPECPICLEDIKEDTKIMMCNNGHLICGGCHDKPEMEPKICPSCKMAITGRCHGMEAYLRNLFGDQNGN